MNHSTALLEWSNWIWRAAFNHLWQATLFFVIAFAVSLLLRRGSARARYVLWLAVSLKFALPSAVIALALSVAGINVQSIVSESPHSTTTLSYIRPVVSPIVIPTSSLPVDQLEYPTESSRNPSKPFDDRLIPLAVCTVWVLGALTFLSVWLKRRRQISRAIENGPVIRAGREWEALQRVKEWLKIDRSIELIVTPEAREPGVWRVFAPVVLLPTVIVSELSDEELEALMMHELGHVLRWDNLVSNLNMILCCIFWFTPIIWLIDRRLLKEREEACDEMVLCWSGTADIYARSLRKIYRICLISHVSGLSTAGGSKLKHRLERIQTDDTQRRFSSVHKALVTTVIIASVLLSVVAGVRPADAFVIDGNNAWVEAAHSLKEQIAGSKAADCFETDVKKCLHMKSSGIQATGTLAQVVVHSDGVAAVQTATNTIANLNEGATTQPVNVPAPRTEAPPNFVSAHALNLDRLVGRYAADPTVMENFVFDITVEDGQVFLKPSHSKRRRLIAESPVEYVDSESANIRITFDFDEIGIVKNLIVRGLGPTVIAPRLVLPPPSRDGNVVFKLSGFLTARIVAVAGTFNGWNQSQYLFERVGDDWICKLPLPAGTYQYKFIVDGNWLVDPSNPTIVRDRRGFENSQLVVR
jgi:beta-lactamase regulating signal transducer with metallopeptidase domain